MRPLHAGDVDETKATARLPGLDVEIVHRRSPDGGREQMTIHLQAAPSFEAFGRFLELANPFAFWAEATRLAWSAWSDAAQASLPGPLALPAPKNRPEPARLAGRK